VLRGDKLPGVGVGQDVSAHKPAGLQGVGHPLDRVVSVLSEDVSSERVIVPSQPQQLDGTLGGTLGETLGRTPGRSVHGWLMDSSKFFKIFKRYNKKIKNHFLLI
jgi:hypothetical protein